MLVGALSGAATRAHAAAGPGMTITFPISVGVGQTGIPAWISLQNLNTGPDATEANTVCNVGDPAPPCTASEQGIVLVPSCTAVGIPCRAPGEDPGTFAVSSSAIGRARSACSGRAFQTSIVDPALGTVRFTPQPAGAHVTIAAGASCVIDFTVDVLKAPTVDRDPSAPGIQTAQVGQHSQWVGALGSTALQGVARTTSSGTTVSTAPAPPAPCTDCDDDGYLARVDCDEADPAINPGALDAPGNRFDEDCDGRDADYPRLEAAILYVYGFDDSRTRFSSLSVRPVRTDTTVRVRCNGRGCRFKQRTHEVKRSARRLDLSSIVRSSRLRGGATLSIRVTKPGTMGLLRTLTVRKSRRPTQSDRCLLPNNPKSIACPL